MAKVSFTKLKLTKKEEFKNFIYNEQTIQVKQYLPINDKLILISNVINAAQDSMDYANPVKVEIFTNLEIIYNYTNINFTDKQKEDPVKLYDILESNGFINQVIELIPEEEYSFLIESIDECIKSIYSYVNSVRGIMESIAADYENTDLEASEIEGKIKNPENLKLLREVLTKLG